MNPCNNCWYENFIVRDKPAANLLVMVMQLSNRKIVVGHWHKDGKFFFVQTLRMYYMT